MRETKVPTASTYLKKPKIADGGLRFEINLKRVQFLFSFFLQ